MEKYFNIKDWNTYVSNNSEIVERLNRYITDFANAMEDTSLNSQLAVSVNSALGGLKLCPIKINTIEDSTPIMNNFNKIYTELSDKTMNLITAVKYYEVNIENYSEGGTLVPYSEFRTTATPEQIQELIGEIYSVNEGLAFSVNYINFIKDKEEFLGGFPPGAVLSPLWKAFSKSQYFLETLSRDEFVKVFYNLSKISSGAGIAFAFSAAISIFKTATTGDFTNLDIARVALSGMRGALTYYAWAGIAGAIGGPLGLVVGTVGGGVVYYVFDKIKDLLVGDNIIHTFEIDGVKYEVPRNGNGENGTYDVILKNYMKANKHDYTINGEKYSERAYKEKLYTNWKDFIYADGNDKLASALGIDDVDKYPEDDCPNFHLIRWFDNTLSEITKMEFSSEEELFDYIMDSYDQENAAYNKNTDSDMTLSYLNFQTNFLDRYGFNFWEYYNYNKGV